MNDLTPKAHSAFTRLQRSSLILKGIFWSFLAALFFVQQITTAFAQESHIVLQTTPPINVFSPEVLVSFAAVIGIGIVAAWLIWDRARMTHH